MSQNDISKSWINDIRTLDEFKITLVFMQELNFGTNLYRKQNSLNCISDHSFIEENLSQFTNLIKRLGINTLGITVKDNLNVPILYKKEDKRNIFIDRSVIAINPTKFSCLVSHFVHHIIYTNTVFDFNLVVKESVGYFEEMRQILLMDKPIDYLKNLIAAFNDLSDIWNVSDYLFLFSRLQKFAETYNVRTQKNPEYIWDELFFSLSPYQNSPVKNDLFRKKGLVDAQTSLDIFNELVKKKYLTFSKKNSNFGVITNDFQPDNDKFKLNLNKKFLDLESHILTKLKNLCYFYGLKILESKKSYKIDVAIDISKKKLIVPLRNEVEIIAELFNIPIDDAFSLLSIQPKLLLYSRFGKFGEIKANFALNGEKETKKDLKKKEKSYIYRSLKSNIRNINNNEKKYREALISAQILFHMVTPPEFISATKNLTLEEKTNLILKFKDFGLTFSGFNPFIEKTCKNKIGNNITALNIETVFPVLRIIDTIHDCSKIETNELIKNAYQEVLSLILFNWGYILGLLANIQHFETLRDDEIEAKKNIPLEKFYHYHHILLKSIDKLLKTNDNLNDTTLESLFNLNIVFSNQDKKTIDTLNRKAEDLLKKNYKLLSEIPFEFKRTVIYKYSFLQKGNYISNSTVEKALLTVSAFKYFFKFSDKNAINSILNHLITSDPEYLKSLNMPYVFYILENSRCKMASKHIKNMLTIIFANLLSQKNINFNNLLRLMKILPKQVVLEFMDEYFSKSVVKELIFKTNFSREFKSYIVSLLSPEKCEELLDHQDINAHNTLSLLSNEDKKTILSRVKTRTSDLALMREKYTDFRETMRPGISLFAYFNVNLYSSQNIILPYPYYILGVPIFSKNEILRKSLRLLAKAYHPDHIQDEIKKEKASEIMVEVNRSYKIVTDPKQVRQYVENISKNGCSGETITFYNKVRFPWYWDEKEPFNLKDFCHDYNEILRTGKPLSKRNLSLTDKKG